jgi:hypothetical protein
MLRSTLVPATAVVLLLAGCSSSGSSSASSGSSPASPSAPSAPSASASGSAAPGQPVTAADGRAFFARYPGAVEAAPAFDPAILTDLDRGLAGQVAAPTGRAIFSSVPAARPAGVVVQIYLFCPLGPGTEQCEVTAPDYQAFVEGCTTVGGVRIQRLVERGTGWAAAGACLSRFGAAQAAALARDAQARFAAAGLAVTPDADLAAIAADWSRYRAGQADPGEFTAVDTPPKVALGNRLKARPTGATRSRAACGAETNPIPAVGAASVQGLVDLLGAGAKVLLGTGAAVGHGRLVLVWCFQKQL